MIAGELILNGRRATGLMACALTLAWLLSGCDSTATTSAPQTPPSPDIGGFWQASLKTPGGPLRFQLEFDTSGGRPQGWIHNGSERIALPRVRQDDNKLLIDIRHYDSRIDATLSDDGRRWSGTWSKKRSEQEPVQVEFSAVREKNGKDLDTNATASAAADKFVGRWRVEFSGSEDPAVGIFTAQGDSVEGTFLTTVGDYRFLAGDATEDRLELSCFDGAHSFLFRAELQTDGSLQGDFWSGTWWQESWQAVRDDEAALPDPLNLTTWNDGVTLSELQFPDLDGKTRSLDDPSFAGKVRIIQIFGSWCPNCHDAAVYLTQLHQKYADQGLSVVGLAFELTEDFERSALQVSRYIERHDTPYPVLIAGPSDKAKASERLRALDRIRSYPTTIFLDASGQVRAIYTGFSGPATGPHHELLKQTFERLIEEGRGERRG